MFSQFTCGTELGGMESEESKENSDEENSDELIYKELVRPWTPN